ncbi:unnamed protein product [Ilex paraguariensis]|uniref:Uncharacterized protein n=1 Tax=Ilex paraguariensis TaxID=185542 RepID=A0ABC8S9T4_9AQUA
MAVGAEVSGETAVEVPVVQPSPIADTADANSNNNAIPLSNGVQDSGSNSNSKSELPMTDLTNMLSNLKLNPMAKEFFPSSYNRDQLAVNNVVTANMNSGNDGHPNNRRRRNNYNQSRRRLSGRAFRAQRDDSIRRTVYVADIDHSVTEEHLATLFSSCGQLNNVMSLRVGSSLKGVDGHRLNSEGRLPAYRYEINDLKGRCREKLLDFFIALRREIADEDFLMQCRHWMEKTKKGTTHQKGIPQGAPISPSKHLSARSRPMDRKKDAGKENEI